MSSVLDALGLRPAWQRDAACREHPLVNFHPERGERGERADPAKRVCAGCLVRDECLDYALAAGIDLSGVWGGLTHRERALALRRQRASSQRQETRPESPLRARRRLAGLTQRELADRLGVTQEAVSAWERGVTAPRPALTARIDQALTTASP